MSHVEGCWVGGCAALKPLSDLWTPIVDHPEQGQCGCLNRRFPKAWWEDDSFIHSSIYPSVIHLSIHTCPDMPQLGSCS